ncbi:MAG: hypothetical protein ACRELU_08100 [Gemmatimonadota bacterium]
MAGDAFPAEVARDSVVARLRGIAEYIELFSEAFPEEARNRFSRWAARASHGFVLHSL